MNHTDARQRFASRLQATRVEQGFTQEQLAETIGKSTEHISFLERSERSPSFEILLDLAEALHTSASFLIGGEDEVEPSIIDVVAVAPISESLPAPVEDEPGSEQQRLSDLDRLQSALEGIRAMQNLADEYGIHDILQDNGGKVLQVLILLRLKISPGREGNDAVDASGHEYELKTVNRSLNKNAGITTHHHLNRDILRKYRSVKAWYIAIYEGVELKEIYRILPKNLEPLFQQWEQKIDRTGTALNNPKIPIRFVRAGELVYPR